VSDGGDGRGAAEPCNVDVWLADCNGGFLGGGPEESLAARLADAIRRVATDGGKDTITLEVAGQDGRRQQVEAALRAVGDVPRSAVAIAVSKRAADDVYRLKRFDLVLEATRDAVWEWVVADGAVWWNERCNAIFGYAPGTAPTFAGWTERIHPDERERVVAGYMATVHSTHDAWSDEYRIVRADGAVRTVIDHGRVERDGAGKALRLVGVMSDVTDEREARAARAQLDQQFKQLAEAVADVTWMSDATTREILYVSPAHERIFGPEGRAVFESTEAYLAAIHPDDRPRILARIGQQLTGEYEETYRIVRSDGKERWVHSRTAPIRDERGNVVRIAGLISDITAQRQLEEQLLQSRKMESVGRLAGGVAHDFNNLLTVILSASEFALRHLPTDHKVRIDIEQVKEAADRAAKLTAQLLAFARRQVIAPVRLDLNELARQMDKLLRRVIGEHIELITTLSPGLHPVLADPSQLEQVLVNLAVNARDAMPDGGRLTLETGNVRIDHRYADSHANVEIGEYVMIAVSDTGMGIPRDVIEHMFEPFFTTKAQGSGTGLGLATCYGIVRQAGGQILVYSELGRGTTFKILLPRTSAAETVMPRDADSAPPGGHETVLFVEDDAPVRAVGVRILAEQGYRVLEAWGGWEALRIAAEHPGPIHVLVTDVVMPHMSGTELARRLRERRPETRVLYTSGYTENAIVHHGVLDPNLAFLQKPYVTETLLAKVRAVLDGST
jgi:two-component system cell cycle sensor histidine kinase/response regulator CckA